MPNWCGNMILLHGPSKDIDELREKSLCIINREIPNGEVTDTDYTFRGVTPDPAITKAEDWWENENHAWGTKWDAQHYYEISHTKFDDDTSVWSFGYDTAWSPPEPVVMAIAYRYPEVRVVHKYDEPGMGFAGVYLSEAGTQAVADLEIENDSVVVVQLSNDQMIIDPGTGAERVLPQAPSENLRDAVRAESRYSEGFGFCGVFIDKHDQCRAFEEVDVSEVLAEIKDAGQEIEDVIALNWSEYVHSGKLYDFCRAILDKEDASPLELALYSKASYAAHGNLVDGPDGSYFTWGEAGDPEIDLALNHWEQIWSQLLSEPKRSTAALLQKVTAITQEPEEIVATCQDILAKK